MATFEDVCRMAIKDPEFVTNYDRLTGNHLSALMGRTPIEQMMDKNTGFECSEMGKFCDFIYEFIWCRIPREATT